MSPPPRVAVLLANFNGARFLDEAIASVAAQTFRDWEMVVVDTGSDDESVAILERWAALDGRIKPGFFPERMSCPAALNVALERSESPLVARIESDDLWEPGRLEAQVQFYDRPENARVGVLGTAATLIDESGAVTGLKRFPESHADCMEMIWFRTPLCHSSVLLRRAAFEECGGYDDRYRYCEDLELWFRVGRRWEVRNLPEALTRYRVWTGSLTTRRLTTLVWRSWLIRMWRAPALGYEVPLGARVYSCLSFGVLALPPFTTRRLYEFVVQQIGDRVEASPGQRGDSQVGQGSSNTSSSKNRT